MQEQIENLHVGNLRVIQNKNLFMFGIDAVLLAWFSYTKKTDSVVDLCTGNAIVPILMSGTKNASSYTALEIQEEVYALAKKSVLLNGLEEKIDVIKGDVKYIEDFVLPKSASVVTVNPPYMALNSFGRKSSSKTEFTAKEIARHEILCTLEDVVRASSYVLKPCGKLFMIHRPERLCEIFSLFEKYKFEVKRIQFVFPFENKNATMVLIEARKDSKPGLSTERPIVVYEKPGIYTKQIEEIYGR